MRKELALLGFVAVIAAPLRADVAIVAADGFRQPDKASKEAAKKARRSGRPGPLAVTGKTATGSVQLIDNSGLKYFINTNITFSTSSSASAAMSEASFTGPIAASTSAGGSVNSTLTDMFDGYNAICVSLTGATGPCATGNPSYVLYEKNGPAAVDATVPATPECTNRQYVYPAQTIGGLSVRRKVYVPPNDNFARWMNIFTNTTGAPITFNMITSNNLGSDANTVIVTSSSGDAAAQTSDRWVTTFQNYSGNTSSDPRIGHVLWDGAGTSTSPSFVNFANGDDNPWWTYTVTLNPGQTKIVMGYVVGTGSKAAAAAKAAYITDGAHPATISQCMSATEKTESFNFTFLPPTDVSITKTAPAYVNQGANVTYALAVSNTGATAQNVVVSDTLPAGLTYVSNSCGGTFSAGTFSWTTASLASPGSASCNLVATVTAAPGTVIANTATVAEDNPDSNAANNTSTASFTVLGNADLSITKTTTSTVVLTGSPVTYTLTATNNGPNPAVGVVVTDTLPASLTYVSNTCGATFAAGTLTWNIGAMASGASAACSFTANVAGSPGSVSNTATISATNTDATPGNNSSTAAIRLALASAIPTLGTVGLVALGGALAALGLLLVRRSS